MKVIAINGSPRREGNTFSLINSKVKNLSGLSEISSSGYKKGPSGRYLKIVILRSLMPWPVNADIGIISLAPNFFTELIIGNN